MPVDQDAAYQVVARHYLLLSFGVSLGAVQIVASVSGLRGMWLAPSARAARLLGIVLVVCSVALFVIAPVWVEGPWAAGSVDADSSTRRWGRASWDELAGAYNINDIDGGLSGTAQALWFPVAVALALGTTLVVGAAVSALRRNVPPPEDSDDGLEAFKGASYPRVLARSLRALRSSWRRELVEQFDRARHPWGLPARVAALWRQQR